MADFEDTNQIIDTIKRNKQLSSAITTSPTITFPVQVNAHDILMKLKARYNDDLQREGHPTMHSNIDLLVISCMRHRTNRIINLVGYDRQETERLINTTYSELVLPEDYKLAADIKDYYLKKFSWYILAEKPLSNFRTNLLEQLKNPNITTFTHETIGMLFSLPAFYQYDIGLDEFIRKATPIDVNDFRSFNVGQIEKSLDVLYVAKKTYVKRKSVFYWMLDENKYPCLLVTDENNPLLPLLNMLLSKTIHATCSELLCTRDNFTYKIVKLHDVKL